MPELNIFAKKAVGGAAASSLEFPLEKSSTVGDICVEIARAEKIEASQVTLLSKGKQLKDTNLTLLQVLELIKVFYQIDFEVFSAERIIPYPLYLALPRIWSNRS